jgi:glycosyltransferase 2 family protein
MSEANGTLIGKTTSTAEPGQRQRVWIRMTLSYVLAIACLVWVFHDYDLSDLHRRVARTNLLLATLAIFCDVLSFVCQGWRWRLLLRPFGSISILRATQAIYSGMFVNEVLPMKLGELLRAFLISRWTSVKLATVATSIVIERLFDGLWLVVAFVVTIIFIPLPRRLIEAGDVLSAVVLILIALLIAISLRSSHAVSETDVSTVMNYPQNIAEDRKAQRNSVAHRLALSVRTFLNRLAIELRVIAHSPSSLMAFGLSLLVVSLQWLAFWLVVVAYGLPLSLPEAAAVFVIVHVGTSMPGAPANVGTYQFFTVLGLKLFGIDKTSAAGFSLVGFVLLSAHIWLLGFWAFRGSGLTLLGMRSELTRQ